MPRQKIKLDLDGKSYEDLLEMCRQLEFDLASIRSQLEKAVDPKEEWVVASTKAQWIKGQQIQLIQGELGRRSRGMREARSREIENRFMTLAKTRLDPDQFQALLNEALTP